MKNILIIFILLLVSCNSQEENIELSISNIKDSNFELFNGVTIEARNEKDGIYKAPFLTKELNGKEYLLPNFLHHGCTIPEKECLEKISTKKFDILEFHSDNNPDSTVDAYTFANEYTLPIFNEFEKLRAYYIISDSSIGNCIIFLLNEDYYLAFVPNIEDIINDFWKSKFAEENKIEDNWYFGTR
jgi:hypothetical protein